MAEFKKSPTYRMLAAELAATTVKLQAGDRDQYMPNIYLSPTGAEVNRVMIVGAAVEKEDIGNDNPFYRVRVADPTGAVFAYAGQYQPEALDAINKLITPCFVAVVGKVSHYTPESGGDTIVSMKVESIAPITAQQRDLALADTAHHTAKRLLEALNNQKVLDAYPGFDFKAFAKSMDELLNQIIEGSQETQNQKPEPPKETQKKEEPKVKTEAPRKEEKPTAPQGKKKEKPKAEAQRQEEELPELDDSAKMILGTIKTHARDKPISKETLNNVLVALGYSMLNVNAILDRLKASGVIIEPKVDHFKAV